MEVGAAMGRFPNPGESRLCNCYGSIWADKAPQQATTSQMQKGAKSKVYLTALDLFALQLSGDQYKV